MTREARIQALTLVSMALVVASLAAGAVGFVLSLVDCTPVSPVAPPADVTIVSADGAPDGCLVQYEICKARLIRAPNGQPLCVPCP